MSRILVQATVALLLAAVGTVSAADVPSQFEIGQRIPALTADYFDRALWRPAGRSFSPPAEQNWEGFRFMLASPRPGMSNVPQLIGVQFGDEDPLPVGFRQAGGARFIMDTMGDGELDTVFHEAIVPFWVLYPEHGNPRASDRFFLLMLDVLLEGYEGNRDPRSRGGLFDEAYTASLLGAGNPDLVNRDLYYHLLYALRIEDDYPEAAYYSWMYLGSMVNDRYGLDHPLPAVQAIRLAHELGKRGEVVEWLHFMQRVRRGLVAAQIYDTLRETNDIARESKRRWVLDRNPDHWWVEKMLGE